MKPDAILINTARGGLVDEYALADALNNNVIAGACIDTLTYEPMREDCPAEKCKKLCHNPSYRLGAKGNKRAIA